MPGPRLAHGRAFHLLWPGPCTPSLAASMAPRWPVHRRIWSATPPPPPFCRGGIICLKLSPNLRHQAIRAEEMHSSPEGSPLLRIPRPLASALDASATGPEAAAGEADLRNDLQAGDLAEAMAALKRVRDSLVELRREDDRNQ